MGEETTIPLHKPDGTVIIEVEVSRELADRIDRAARRLGTEHDGFARGDVWLRGLREYGDELQPDASPELYEDVESGEAAKEVWVRSILDHITEDLLESEAGDHRFRIDGEVT